MSNYILNFLWMVAAPAVSFILLSGYVYGLDAHVKDKTITKPLKFQLHVVNFSTMFALCFFYIRYLQGRVDL